MLEGVGDEDGDDDGGGDNVSNPNWGDGACSNDFHGFGHPARIQKSAFSTDT